MKPWEAYASDDEDAMEASWDNTTPSEWKFSVGEGETGFGGEVFFTLFPKDAKPGDWDSHLDDSWVEKALGGEEVDQVMECVFVLGDFAEGAGPSKEEVRQKLLAAGFVEDKENTAADFFQ